MFNNEVFCNEYRNAQGEWQTARFQDDIDEAIPCDAEMHYGDRRPYVIIPVPSETKWITDELSKQAETSIGAQPGSRTGAPAKRARDNEPANDDVSISLMVTDATDGQIDADADSGMLDSAASDDGPIATRPRPAAPAAAGSAPPVQTTDEFPPGAVMVYLYTADDSVKLNEVIEVVGILSRTPELAAIHLEHAATVAATAADGHQHLPESLLDEEMLAAHPPTSKVPRIHTILVNKETSPYPKNVLSSAIPAASQEEKTTTASASAFSIAQVQELVAAGRSRTLGFLSMVLGGDNLAAEYLLLQLVASVQRRERETVLGVSSLNLTGCPDKEISATLNGLSPLGSAISSAISALTPRCLPLPLSLETLNGASWIPRRGGDAIRMSSGLLQIASGTQIIADETVMLGGQLNEFGLRNLAALQGIMLQQKIAYNFDVFTLDQLTDAPVTVLSSARTMLKGVHEVVVPLKCTAPVAADGAAVEAAIAGGDVMPLRAYIAAAKSVAKEFSIPEAIAVQVEKELTDAKQKDSSLTGEDFHQFLQMARLLAVSYGEKELTMARWAEAVALEKQRRERL